MVRPQQANVALAAAAAPNAVVQPAGLPVAGSLMPVGSTVLGERFRRYGRVVY